MVCLYVDEEEDKDREKKNNKTTAGFGSLMRCVALCWRGMQSIQRRRAETEGRGNVEQKIKGERRVTEREWGRREGEGDRPKRCERL